MAAAVESARALSSAEEAPAIEAVVSPAPATADADGGVPPADDGAPEWPDETVEAAMLAERRESAAPEPVQPARPAGAEDEDDSDKVPLPPVAELQSRLPAEVRGALDDLFRARFTKVAKVPRRTLKHG